MIASTKSTNNQVVPKKVILDNILNATSAQRPFMLFPLRLETHFRKVKNQKQLCVRVIPDEIMLDYHTEKLTKEEIEDGKFFWMQWYIASGSDVREFEAWEVLCKKYPVYRAAWICRCLRPAYIDDYRPGKKFFYRRPFHKLDVIEENCQKIYDYVAKISLYLSEEQKTTSEDDENDGNIPAEEKTPATGEYLIEFHIRTKLTEIQRMLFEIESAISSCKYLVDYLYDNVNSTVAYLARTLDSYILFYERFPKAIGNNVRRLELWDVDFTVLQSLRKDVDNFMKTMKENRMSLDDMVKAYLKDDSLFNFNKINETTKIDIPVSNILPKNFFFIGEVANANKDKIYACSNDIPSDLQMGIDPNETEVDENGQKVSPFQINLTTGDMEIKGGAKWMTDYDEAEKCGMAITVPIANNVNEFNYIYVLGINDFSEIESYERLTNLFNGHNYTSSGISYVAAGTPTNSLDGKFKDETEQIKRERFDIEVNDKYKTSDALAEESSILANFTGMDYESCWRRIAGGDQKQDSIAKRVYSELWDHFRNNIKSDDEYLNHLLDSVGDFVVNNVRARGILPTIKVGSLPYGLLPTADFKKFLETLDSSSAEARLLKLCISLANVWKEIRNKQVPHSKTLVGANAEKDYLKMAGQTPYSASFIERCVVRSPFLEKNYLKDPLTGAISDLNDMEFFADQPIADAYKEVSLEGLKNCLSEDLRNDVQDDDLNIFVAEFLDLFTYRLDAWFTGFIKSAKEQFTKEKGNVLPQIGSYGWVFNLRENNREKISDLNKCRDIVREMSLGIDPRTSAIYKNVGSDKAHYVVAPSIQQALTTAVLRSAYLKSKGSATDSHICVNMSSMRVRQALRLVDGVRRGMSTSVVLGVDLERYLHDAKGLFDVELDEFIYPLRKMFRQVVDLKAQTAEADDYTMQVINGEALLNTFIGEWNWSKSVSSWLEENCQGAACLEWLHRLNEESNCNLFGEDDDATKKRHVFFKQIERLMDSYDALNDLLLSEGVHRLVMGDKSSFYAISNFLSTGEGSIPEPEILKIPSEHVVVAHKAGLMLPIVEECPQKAFAIADPSVNAWIESVIGDMDKLRFFVRTKNSKGDVATYPCSLKDINIRGSEYLYLSSYEGTFKNYLEVKWRLSSSNFSDEIEILERSDDDKLIPEDDELSLEEDKVRLKALRSIVLHSREMRASDLQSALWEGAGEEEYTDIEELYKQRYELLISRTNRLLLDVDDWIRNASNKGNDIYDNSLLLDAYKYLCECVETGVIDCLDKFNTDIFTSDIDLIMWPERIEKAQTLQQELLNAMEDVKQKLSAKLENAKSIVESKTVNNLVSAIQTLTLEKIKVIPHFYVLKNEFANITDINLLERALKVDNAIKSGPNFYKNLDYDAFDQWEDEVSEVRDGMKNIHQLSMFQTAIDRDLGRVAVLQTESTKSDVVAGNWLGLAVNEESELQDVDSMVLYNTDVYNTQSSRNVLSLAANAGFVVDSWLEYIPYKKHNAGLVFHADRPDNEAPQAILVAVNHQINSSQKNKSNQVPEKGTNSSVDSKRMNSASRKLCWCPACRKENLLSRNHLQQDEKWNIDSLLGILDETRFMMMNRAVDPDAVYANVEINTIFPLLSNIEFTDLKQLSASAGITSGTYSTSDIFSSISGNKNIKE